MNKHPNENIGEDGAYLFLELENPDFESTMMSAIAEIMLNHSDEQERVQKSVSTEDMARAEARGLVPQSGNWKKPKRWVRPKGAVISKTRKKAHDDLILDNSTKEAMKSLFGEDFDRSTLQDMYSIGLEDYSTEITKLDGDINDEYGFLSLHVSIHDEKIFDDRPVAGFMERNFMNRDGKLTVEHSRFMVYETYRNQGIASDISENVEKHYEKLGVHSITLSANATVGGYTWARQGYDFVDDTDRDKIRDRFKSNVRKLHEIGRFKESLDSLLEEIDSFEHSWEFASWNPSGFERKYYEDFTPVGKGLMVNTTWGARKTLDKNSIGYKIGKAYFAAKRNTPITG